MGSAGGPSRGLVRGSVWGVRWGIRFGSVGDSVRFWICFDPFRDPVLESSFPVPNGMGAGKGGTGSGRGANRGLRHRGDGVIKRGSEGADWG